TAQATSPATGGIRYISGAVRATPRTAFTHPHASQPTKAEPITAHSRPAHSTGESCDHSMPSPTGSDSATIGTLPRSVAEVITTTPPWRSISGFAATVKYETKLA